MQKGGSTLAGLLNSIILNIYYIKNTQSIIKDKFVYRVNTRDDCNKR